MVDAVESMPGDVAASLGRARDELVDAVRNGPTELFSALDDAVGDRVDLHVHDAIREGRARAKRVQRRGPRSLALRPGRRDPSDEEEEER